MRAAARQVGTGPLLLATLPVALLFLVFLTSWAWRALGWPSFMYLPPVHWAVVGVLLVGALVGVFRGMPRWAYSWAGLALYGLGTVGEVATFAAYSVDGVVEADIGSAFQWANRAVSIVWVLLALGGTVFLARRSYRDALFFFALFIAAKAVGFPILVGENAPSYGGATTTIMAVLALGEGVVLVWLLWDFIAGRGAPWRPVWGVVGLTLLNVLLKSWHVFLGPEHAADKLRIWATGVGSGWFQELLPLAAALVAGWVYLALPRKAR